MRLTVFAVTLLFAAALRAHEHAPRVLSPHVADTYSLKTFADYERWRALEGDAKAFEVFRYLADRRTGVYPMGVPAREGPEELYEYGSVTDPVKMLNVYPLGHCGTLGPAMAGIAEGMGLGRARTLIIPGWGHVASEVFYGGKWRAEASSPTRGARPRRRQTQWLLPGTSPATFGPSTGRRSPGATTTGTITPTSR
jgi:hypothetical protein